MIADGMAGGDAAARHQGLAALATHQGRTRCCQRGPRGGLGRLPADHPGLWELDPGSAPAGTSAGGIVGYILTAALVAGQNLPGANEVGVELPAWLNGLAEAASELRRHLLDWLRGGELDLAERLLREMEDVYELAVSIDYPDAVTGGLPRSADALRAVLERTRSDLTTGILQARLQAAIGVRLSEDGDEP